GLRELARNLGRWAADERSDAVPGRRDLSLAGGYRGQRGAELGLRPLGIEGAAATRVETLLRQVEGVLLVLGVAAGDLQLLLRSAQLEVGARQLRRQRDLYVAQIFLRRAHQRPPRLDGMADSAEHIQIPRCVDARVPDALV